MENMRLRVETLLPKAKCFIRSDEIITWEDERPQPTEAELLAVDVDAINAAEAAKDQEIDSEISGSQLANITFSAADAKIDTIFANAATVAQLKAACVTAFKLVAKLLIAITKKQRLSN